MTTMSWQIEKAIVADVDELLKLYFLIYQNNYPLAICSDRAVMTAAIQNKNTHWYVTRDPVSKAIIASTVFETDPQYKIGKLTGVVVHPEYRKRDLASLMIGRGTKELLLPAGPLRSIYTTTRTTSRGPQIMCLKNGFLPLGIFPNAHKIEEFETLTLMAKFGEGVIETKPSFCAVPEKIAPIAAIFNESVGVKTPVEIIAGDAIPMFTSTQPSEPLAFELIHAKHYVKQRFNERYLDPYDRFYPFHEPNMLIVSTNNEIEIFAYINEADGYVAIVALNKPIYQVRERLRPLLHQLRNIGVSYIEVLIGLQHTRSLAALLDGQFLPSAIYPAMSEVNGKAIDFVLMTRTLEPLNFRGMQIESGFKAYVELYLKLWKGMFLETLEVFSEYKS